MKRREFLKASAVGVALGATPLMNFGCGPRKLDKIGLQLYTMGRTLRDDFEGTITAVAEAGYDFVEFAGYNDVAPQDVRALIDRLGLTSPANHTGANLLTEETLPETIAAAKIVGHEYLVLPSLPREMPANFQMPPRPPAQAPQGERPARGEGEPQGERPQWTPPPPPVYTVEKTLEFVQTFHRIGEACREAGLRFAFHNHQTEFQELDGGGGIMMDVMLQESDPDLVDFEIDLGWAIDAGADPVAYFEKYPGRFKLFHVKDLTDDGQPAVIGTGNVDFVPIFANSGLAGVKYYIVEQDGAPDPIANVTDSINFLRSLTF